MRQDVTKMVHKDESLDEKSNDDFSSLEEGWFKRTPEGATFRCSAQVGAHSHVIVTCSMRRTAFRLLRVQAGTTLTSLFLWFRCNLCINEGLD
jgi:hypothetical protein